MDLGNMMGKLKEVQEKMAEAKSRLSKIEVVGEAGGGMVKARVNGQKELLWLEIEDHVYEDKDIMRNLIVSAVNQAMKEADEKANASMKEVAGGFLPNIPGLDFGNFMK